jgi:hypothetical protein
VIFALFCKMARAAQRYAIGDIEPFVWKVTVRADVVCMQPALRHEPTSLASELVPALDGQSPCDQLAVVGVPSDDLSALPLVVIGSRQVRTGSTDKCCGQLGSGLLMKRATAKRLNASRHDIRSLLSAAQAFRCIGGNLSPNLSAVCSGLMADDETLDAQSDDPGQFSASAFARLRLWSNDVGYGYSAFGGCGFQACAEILWSAASVVALDESSARTSRYGAASAVAEHTLFYSEKAA